MTDDLVGRLLAMWSHRGDGIPTQYVNPDGPKAAARIEALEAENRSVRMMLADLHYASLAIATPAGSQLDEARDAASAYFAQPRVAQHLKQENGHG